MTYLFNNKKYVPQCNILSSPCISAIFQKYYGAICSLSHRNYRTIANKGSYSLNLYNIQKIMEQIPPYSHAISE